MNKKQLVELEFINKRNELKKVQFYMDKQTYEMLMDESINNDERQKYLIEEYHEYEREKYYKRKLLKFEEEKIDFINNIADNSLSSEELYIKEQEELEFFSFLKELSPRQKEIIKLIYFEDKTQEEVAKIFGVSKSAINQSLNRIYKKIKKIQKDH